MATYFFISFKRISFKIQAIFYILQILYKNNFVTKARVSLLLNKLALVSKTDRSL